jgi:hypothetical protein
VGGIDQNLNPAIQLGFEKHLFSPFGPGEWSAISFESPGPFVLPGRTIGGEGPRRIPATKLSLDLLFFFYKTRITEPMSDLLVLQGLFGSEDLFADVAFSNHCFFLSYDL